MCDICCECCSKVSYLMSLYHTALLARSLVRVCDTHCHPDITLVMMCTDSLTAHSTSYRTIKAAGVFPFLAMLILYEVISIAPF